MAQERSAGLTPQPALCTPQLAVVPLRPQDEPEDPSVIYFPSCTRYNARVDNNLANSKLDISPLFPE